MNTLVEGAMNFRDVGGLPTLDGGRTRFGVLYRSGNLAHVTDAGEKQLADLGLARILDLRDDEEVARDVSRCAGVPIVHVPVFLGSVSSFFTEDMTLVEMYRSMLRDSCDRVVAAVREIATHQPLLVHCTVGKDRTGVSIALALAAAGVEEDAVVANYAETENNLPAERNRAIVERLRAHYPEFRNLEELTTKSPAQAMATILAELREEYGSVAGFLLEHGLTKAELEALRSALVEPAS